MILFFHYRTYRSSFIWLQNSKIFQVSTIKHLQLRKKCMLRRNVVTNKRCDQMRSNIKTFTATVTQYDILTGKSMWITFTGSQWITSPYSWRRTTCDWNEVDGRSIRESFANASIDSPSAFTWNLFILGFLYLPLCPFVCLVDARYWRISASGTRISIINAATAASSNRRGEQRGTRVGEEHRSQR